MKTISRNVIVKMVENKRGTTKIFEFWIREKK